MTAQILAVIVTMLAGAAVARLLRGPEFIGLWYLYGSGVIAIALQWLPWWRLVVIVIAVLSVTTLALIRSVPALPRRSLIDAATGLILAAYASFATITNLWEWDAWGIWGLKARVFFEHGSVDWEFLLNPDNAFVHPDYPLLVPTALGLPAILGGAWDDRWIGIVTVATLASATMALREVTAREFSPNVSATIAFAFAALGSTQYVSTAETAFMACSVCGLAFLRAGEWRHASILLGLGALAKNEGLALIAAAAVALILMRRWRDVPRLWPAAAIATTWLIARAIHRLPTDVISGSLLDRASAHAASAGEMAGLLIRHTDRGWLWVAVILAVPFAIRAERLILAIVAIQLALFIAVYIVTPYDLAWHITNSWDRLSRQLIAMAAFAVMCAIAHDRDQPRINVAVEPSPSRP